MFHADKMLGSFKKPCQKLRNYFGFTNPEVPPFEYFFWEEFLGKVEPSQKTLMFVSQYQLRIVQRRFIFF